ncbi:DUF2093 domain-containing protein [Taklimakanibacter deserti]|jgi:hypothetical protein|uniref:DUF2093 domain-containing protein n=1 Tax=Taklimakanibacter deserti TaxID=2267839 RepID=UPI000E64B9BB
MNRHESFLPRGRQAKIRYLDADFQVLSEGDHVICAVTGMPIKIEQLTYWSVARQEPYISAEAAFRRLLETEFR